MKEKVLISSSLLLGLFLCGGLPKILSHCTLKNSFVNLLLIEHGEPFIKYRHDDQILDSISDLLSNGYLWHRVKLQGYLLLTYGGRAGYGREPLKKDDRRVASSVRPRQFS